VNADLNGHGKAPVGSAVGAPPDPAALLGQLASQLQDSGNPALQLLSIYLLAQSGAGANGDVEPVPDGLQEELVAAWAEIDVLRRRVTLVAAALGRCDVCWGEDAGCRFCGGKGSSGHFWPDRSSYEELIAPAVDRVRETGRDRPPRVDRAGVFDPPLGHVPRIGRERADPVDERIGDEEGGTG
jgi:hypothetical protein